MDEIRISVVVPVFNADRWLAQCVDSLLAQTHPNLEILLIDDGSQDSSRALCDAYAAADRRVQVIHQRNSGVSSARNAGLEQATGKYIAFVDADDYVEAVYCEKLLTAILSDDSDMAICGYYRHKGCADTPVRYGDGYLYVADWRQEGELLHKLVQHNLFNPSWGKLYRRELVTENFHVELNIGEDMLFNLDYLENIRNIAIIPDCLIYYRLDDTVVSLNRNFKQENIQALLYVYEKLTSFFEKRFDERYRESLLNCFAGALKGMTTQAVLDTRLSRTQKLNLIRGWMQNEEIVSNMCTSVSCTWAEGIHRWTFLSKLPMLYYGWLKTKELLRMVR